MIDSEDRLSKGAKIFILLIILFLFFIVYIYRLFSMQIVQGEHYRSQSQRISSQISVISAQRGEIFDRNALLPIVINTDSFAVEVTPGEIPKDRYDTVILKLAQYLGISKTDIDKKIPKNMRRSYTTVQVKSNVPFTVISNIAENKIDLPGVSWVSKPIRNYQHTGSMSHIVGYVGDINQDEMTVLYNQGYKKTSIVGKTGIEKQYDSLLQGKEGREMSTVDVHGRIISDTPIVEPPEMGKSLVLTIDSDIQKLVEEALGSRVGASVVLKPATGEVLAMVSYPYYDSNIFSSDDAGIEYAKLVNDTTKPLLNRAVQVSYPPASTFKIIMSAAMLQENAFPAAKKIEITSKKNHKIISNIMDTTKNQIQNENNQNQNSSDKYSSYFYSSKPNININKIINKVIDENKKANIFRSLNYFDNIGKNFANHLKTRKNFYVNKNENSKDYFKDNNKKEKKTLNSLKIIILSPFKWKKHEEIWSNILQLSKISKELHKYLLPPNDNDVIISSYLKLFPKVLNFCSINNKLNATNKETDFISFNIDDNIANPKKEIKNWKMAYKQVIFRWHPDKLNAILNEINLDENIKNILFKKSTIIINNMNKIFKSILEILNKIIKNKTIE